MLNAGQNCDEACRFARLHDKFRRLKDALEMSEAELVQRHEAGALDEADEAAIVEYKNSLGQELYELSMEIIGAPGQDDQWLALKAKVAMHYAEPERDIAHLAAFRLARAVLVRSGPEIWK